MTSRKTIICLANSYKANGRCVAGIELLSDTDRGDWIRPISTRDRQQLKYERLYPDKSDPKLLDVLSVPLASHIPEGCQTENWLIDPLEQWQKITTFSSEGLSDIVDTQSPLWLNAFCSALGRNDRIPEWKIGTIQTSLKLIYVYQFTVDIISINTPTGVKRKIRGKFSFSGDDYNLSITDPKIMENYRARPLGSYEIGSCYITVSLGELFGRYRYKLIAGVVR